MTVGVVERCETEFQEDANAVPNGASLRDKRMTRIGFRLGTCSLFRNLDGLILREGDQKNTTRGCRISDRARVGEMADRKMGDKKMEWA
ncbi:hypothetical protein TBK1r_67200 [Stieleria magnilauensis]|uniref:Uncharacterized protein n=1 Tax=Stieleria magnilauensis TaxID=2527963 RepID=A0ABX5Y079_9BACT|nr:hypothetical protein TBK1r_67200 [Planctomycetes bacterium TBK1r]